MWLLFTCPTALTTIANLLDEFACQETCIIGDKTCDIDVCTHQPATIGTDFLIEEWQLLRRESIYHLFEIVACGTSIVTVFSDGESLDSQTKLLACAQQYILNVLQYRVASPIN